MEYILIMVKEQDIKKKIKTFFVYKISFVEIFKFSFKKCPNVLKLNQTEGPYIYLILIQFQGTWSHFEGELENFNEGKTPLKFQLSVLASF